VASPVGRSFSAVALMRRAYRLRQRAR
jgi:hypothetical protein